MVQAAALAEAHLADFAGSTGRSCWCAAEAAHVLGQAGSGERAVAAARTLFGRGRRSWADRIVKSWSDCADWVVARRTPQQTRCLAGAPGRRRRTGCCHSAGPAASRSRPLRGQVQVAGAAASFLRFLPVSEVKLDCRALGPVQSERRQHSENGADGGKARSRAYMSNAFVRSGKRRQLCRLAGAMGEVVCTARATGILLQNPRELRYAVQSCTQKHLTTTKICGCADE